jgi:hypothetical protein
MARIMELEARSDAQRVFTVENTTFANVEVTGLRAKTIFLEERVRQLEEQVIGYE